MVSDAVQIDFKKSAEAELAKIRENCHKWAVTDEIQRMREYLARAGLTLADIGTTEDELKNCYKTGHRSSAQSWLQVAKDCCKQRDVSFELGLLRSRLAEASLALTDIGSSEDELSRLLAAAKTSRKGKAFQGEAEVRW